MSLSSSVDCPFLQVETYSECGLLWHCYWFHADADRVMLVATKMRSGMYPFFHLLLVKDFGSLASCIGVRLHYSAHLSTICDVVAP